MTEAKRGSGNAPFKKLTDCISLLRTGAATLTVKDEEGSATDRARHVGKHFSLNSLFRCSALCCDYATDKRSDGEDISQKRIVPAPSKLRIKSLRMGIRILGYGGVLPERFASGEDRRFFRWVLLYKLSASRS